MRENRTSGSEGGARLIPRPDPYRVAMFGKMWANDYCFHSTQVSFLSKAVKMFAASDVNAISHDGW